MRMEIEGKAKATPRQYGAWLRGDSGPCDRNCEKRKEGCKGSCREYKIWNFKHQLAIEENRKLMQARVEAAREHRTAVDRAERRMRRK